MKLAFSVFAAFLVAFTGLNAQAGDWPTILGPGRNGVSTEKGIIAPWPKAGLKKLWECDLGIGFAPPVVAGGRLFHFDRFQDTARVTCRDAVTGKELWKFEYPTAYEDRYGYDPGPRACPVVDQDRVYLYGAEGMLYCLKTDNGKELWHVDTQEKYNFKQNFFGVGSVPVVDDGLLIVAVGGSAKGPRPADFRDVKPNGTGLVAFNKLTGEVKYATGDELASYSSPIVANLNGKKTALYFSRAALVGFDPQTGETAFRHPWRARDLESVNASNPVVIGDKVLLSECYGPGSVLLDLKGGKPKEVWSDADKDRLDKSLLCHWNTPIHVNGFIYGCSGRHDNDAELRCIELATGDVKWVKRKTFRCTLLLVDGYFICLSEYGVLSLLKVNPEKYEEVSKYEIPPVYKLTDQVFASLQKVKVPEPLLAKFEAVLEKLKPLKDKEFSRGDFLNEIAKLLNADETKQFQDLILDYAEVPELEYPCWAPPVLSNGILYLRGKRKLLALELIPGRKP